MHTEMTTCKNVCDMFLEKEDSLNEKIKQLTIENQYLNEYLNDESLRLKTQIEKMKAECHDEIVKQKVHNNKFKQIIEVELKIC